MELKINDIVREKPDDTGECRFTGRIAGFTEVDGTTLVIVLLEVGFYSNHTDKTPLYTSLLVVHPSNLILI